MVPLGKRETRVNLAFEAWMDSKAKKEIVVL